MPTRPRSWTPLERDIALALGIPMFGADPRLAPLGSKSGGRRLFEEVGVPHPAGEEGLHTTTDLVAAIRRIRQRRPSVSTLIVKLDEGVSGAGNALVELPALPRDGGQTEDEAIAAAVRANQPEAPGLGPAEFLGLFARHGGIVEERISGVELTSPSVQMRVLPDRSVEVLSTHDQLLGGTSGQQYLGCVFPADPAYSRKISEPALAIARHLAGLGVLGRFAVDFVVVRDESGDWTPYVIELNLRKGGTTHPFLTLQFLTDGTSDADAGVYLTPSGTPKFLVATEHLEDDRLRWLSVDDLFDLVATRSLHFDKARSTGVVFHLISALTECGRIGLTAVGDTPEEAWQIYRETAELLVAEAEQARSDGPLVG